MEPKFAVFKLANKEDQFVAVPEEFVGRIEMNAIVYGAMDRIPETKEVPAIMLRHTEGDEYYFDPFEEQNNIIMNQLRSIEIKDNFCFYLN